MASFKGGRSTVVGTLSTQDPDRGDSFTYSLVAGSGDTDNQLFQVKDGRLTTAAAIPGGDKTSFAVRLQSVDAGGKAVSKAFVISRNLAPTGISLANKLSSLPENTDTLSRLKVADIVVADDGLGSNVITVGGTDGSSFEVVGTSLFIKAGTVLNFEAQSRYDVTVSVRDPAFSPIRPPAFYGQRWPYAPILSVSHTVTVTDVYEPPASISLLRTSLIGAGMLAAGRVRVADVVVTGDASAKNAVTLSGKDAAIFKVNNSGLYLSADAAGRAPTGRPLAVTVNLASTVGARTTRVSTTFTLSSEEVARVRALAARGGSAVAGDDAWNLTAIDAAAAWDGGSTGAGVVVAVLDSGIDRNHPDLRQAVWSNPKEIAGDRIDNDGNGFVDDVYGWNFVADSNDTMDRYGHGTHVAGIIGAARDGTGVTGVAPGVTLMPVSVLDNDGIGRKGSVARGIYYAVAQGADIINLSVVGVGPEVFEAMAYARDHGVLIVAASGNESGGQPEYPARYSADLVNVISVGAFGPGYEKASFTNTVGGSGAVQVDAPGVGITSTIPGGGVGVSSGTSMAAAHVTGVAAIVRGAARTLAVGALRDALVAGVSRKIAGSDSAGAVSVSRSLHAALAAVSLADARSRKA